MGSVKPAATTAYWHHLHQQLFAPAEARTRSALISWTRDLARWQLARIEQARETDDPSEIVFDLEPWRAEAWRRMEPVCFRVINAAAVFTSVELIQQRLKAAGGDDLVRVPLVFQDAIDSAVARVQARILRDLQEAVERGATRDAQRERIRTRFERMAAGSMRVVADGEAALGVSVGRERAFKGAGVERCRWLTAGDERVRETHVRYGAAGAQKRGFNWPRLIGRRYTLRFPRDPACHEGSDVYGCRCALIAAPRGS